MNDVLLTVSGEIPDDIEVKIANGEKPLTDYLAMAQAFKADLLDYKKARAIGGRFARLLEKFGGRNLMLAWVCFILRGKYRILFTDGEQIGIPLAFFLKFLNGHKRPRHFMITHILSVEKKVAVLDWLRVYTHIDLFFVYSTWQKNFIQTRWGLPEARVIFTPFMVDADFFSSASAQGKGLKKSWRREDLPLICSVGLEFRDYPTLIEAVRGLNVQVVVAAASPWSKRANEMENRTVPDNVIVERFSQYELRGIYADSQLMVMPLYKVNFQAGVTAILEAMAMEKPVICTRTPGQTDVVVDGETGVYVAPQDPAALRNAIVYLLGQPELMQRMGHNGRARILDGMSLERYTSRLSAYVRGSTAEKN
jgi:glycosyltransferase involved in cell wall biosynthesis